MLSSNSWLYALALLLESLDWNCPDSCLFEILVSESSLRRVHNQCQVLRIGSCTVSRNRASFHRRVFIYLGFTILNKARCGDEIGVINTMQTPEFDRAVFGDSTLLPAK